MSLKKTVSEVLFTDLKNQIETLIDKTGVSKDYFKYPYCIHINYWNISNVFDKITPDAHDGVHESFFMLGKSIDQILASDHWFADSCLCENFLCAEKERHSIGDDTKFFGILMDDYYDSLGLVSSLHWPGGITDIMKNTDLMKSITQARSVLHIKSIGQINYIHSTSEDFCRRRFMSYPYCTAFSLHEMFKLLLEWQWAKKELGATEPMAVVSDEYLSILGFDVLDKDNELVQALLELPDQQVFQYIKNGEVKLNTNLPEIPKQFITWIKDLTDLFTLIKRFSFLRITT